MTGGAAPAAHRKSMYVGVFALGGFGVGVFAFGVFGWGVLSVFVGWFFCGGGVFVWGLFAVEVVVVVFWVGWFFLGGGFAVVVFVWGGFSPSPLLFPPMSKALWSG